VFFCLGIVIERGMRKSVLKLESYVVKLDPKFGNVGTICGVY